MNVKDVCFNAGPGADTSYIILSLFQAFHLKFKLHASGTLTLWNIIPSVLYLHRKILSTKRSRLMSRYYMTIMNLKWGNIFQKWTHEWIELKFTGVGLATLWLISRFIDKNIHLATTLDKNCIGTVCVTCLFYVYHPFSDTGMSFFCNFTGIMTWMKYWYMVHHWAPFLHQDPEISIQVAYFWKL